MMRPLPSLALIPVAILIAGLGVTMTSGLVAFAAFWPVFINTRYAVHQIEPKAARLRSRSRPASVGPGPAGGTPPAAAPSMATGVRVSVGLAVVVTVSVELVAGTGGLGEYVLVAQQSGNAGEMYAGVVAGGFLGWGLNVAWRVAADALMPWQAAATGRAR